MDNDEIEKARLRVLEAEAEKHHAEKEKLLLEKQEIERKLHKDILDVSVSSITKTVVAGVVAGILIWSFGLEYVFKINKVNIDLKQQIEEENKKLEAEKVKLELDKKKLKDDLDNTRMQLISFVNNNKSSIKNTSKSNLKKTIVAEVHRLDEQSSNISLVQQKPRTISKGTDKQTGWVYLGEHANGEWKKRYFSFSSKLTPKNLVGKRYEVRVAAINVRTELFVGDITNVLHQGQYVEITKIEKYPYTDYVWAHVKY